MTDIRPDDVEFCHKQTIFGLVLMRRYAVPDIAPGMWCWGPWRKAEYYDMNAYDRLLHGIKEQP